MPRRITQDVLDRAKALQAQGWDMQWIADQLNVHARRLYHWRSRNWTMPPAKARRAIPDDFAQLCQIKNVDDLRKYYKASPKTIRRWLCAQPQEVLDARFFNIGVKIDANGKSHRMGRPTPHGFEGVFLQLGVRGTAEHYTVSEHQIDNWLENYSDLRAQRKEIFTALKNQGRSRPLHRGQRFNHQASLGMVESAAHYLRRFKSQVYQPAKVMVEAGLKNGLPLYRPMGPEGFHYVAGRGLIPTEEMIDMARDMGWQA